MASKKKAIQFIWLKNEERRDSSGLLIEQLRYAGLLSVIADMDTHYVLQAYCPTGLLSDVWAQQNSERMRSFGINAVDVNAEGRSVTVKA